MRISRIIVVSGMSGAGKTTAVHSLEDQGYYCVDNLPVGLLRPFLELIERGDGIRKVALVMDSRGGEFLQGAAEALEQLRMQQYKIEVVFLEASDEMLVRRFQETRRKHPAAAPGETLRGAISRERALLAPLRTLADVVLDSSDYNVHQLRRAVRERYGAREDSQTSLCFLSFGFKYGIPQEVDTLFDVRYLKNPYFVETLRAKSGKEPEVSSYVLEEASPFLARVEDLLLYLMPQYQKEGKVSVTVGIGCTGGRHRSVAIAEALATILQNQGFAATAVHRDIDKGSL